MGQTVDARCYQDIQTRKTAHIIMEEGINTTSNTALVIRIKCDHAGGSVSVNKAQPISWNKYISDIAYANNISPRDVAAHFTILLHTAGGKPVGRWDIDLTQPNIFQGPERFELQGSSENISSYNTVYAIEIINTTGGYAKTQSIKEMSVIPPNEERLLFIDDTPVLGLSSEYKAPKSTCDASSFEVTSPSTVDFGTLQASSLNKKGVIKDFQIELRRKVGVGNCRQEVVKPKIKFSHVGTYDGAGNIFIPEQRLMFQLFRADQSQIILDQYLPMGAQRDQEVLVNKYYAKISKDPKYSSVNLGAFAVTILFEVSYP